MATPKRQKFEGDKEDDDKRMEDVDEEVEADESSSDEGSDSASEDSPDTETEIGIAQRTGKSKKTLKRKRRAVSPTPFGATLTALLSTSAPSGQPLSLKPSVARQKNDEKLEGKAKKVILGEKKEKEEKGRIRDVIGGWGGEGERALRKVAQRGVVKLFNAIQLSQNAASAADADLQNSRGTGKATLKAPKADDFGSARKQKKGKEKNRDNLIGRGKEVALAKDDFLESIRSGGIVSKT